MLQEFTFEGIPCQIQSYFHNEVLQLNAHIQSPFLSYDGSSYCWDASVEMFFFNAELELLASVKKKDIDLIIADDENREEIFLLTNDTILRLQKGSPSPYLIQYLWPRIEF
jgi:hypothetical protein